MNNKPRFRFEIQASPKVLKKFTWDELNELCLSDMNEVSSEDEFCDVGKCLLSEDNKWVVENTDVRTFWGKIKDEVLVALCLKDQKGPFYSFYFVEELGEEMTRHYKACCSLGTGHYRIRN